MSPLPPDNSIHKKAKLDETPEAKKARRKLERRKRKHAKMGTFNLSGKDIKRFKNIFDKETVFIQRVLQALPEVRNPHLYENEEENIDDYLLDGEVGEAKHKQFLEKMKTTRALSHEELRERLQAKLQSVSQAKNEKKRERRDKKKELLKEMKKNGEGNQGGKKFTAKANPNLKNQRKSESTDVKTPLRKKPVVKSNGDIVYSKFDFISNEDPTKKGKPKAEDLLKKVVKAEGKVASLESKGKLAEAASLVESQKWGSALKRAQGEKIRDDSALLKRTIKKMEKKKQVSKKKWEERTENIDKQKKAKQEKRQANIQARKDEKISKIKKQQRKKGRLV